MSGLMHRLLLALKPAPFQINNRERLRALIGAGLAILITSQLSQWMIGDDLHTYWMVGSLGATSLLVFLLPGSPLAQPYAAVLGNTAGACIGVLCAHAGLPPVPSTALAVSGAMAAMFILRCVHPPGVAVALFASLTHITDISFALVPIFTDTLLLVILAAIYNNLTGKAYPHMEPKKPASPAKPASSRFTDEDLDRALARYNQALNISRSELAQVLEYTENATYERILGATLCRDIMSRDPIAVSPDTPQPQAWEIIRSNKLKALPIVDDRHHLLGIATASDFADSSLASATPAPGPRGLRALLGRRKPKTPDAPTVADIMTSPVTHASEDAPISSLIPLFAQQRLRHIPVLDTSGQLTGIVTQSDLLQALYQAVQPD
ncbi:HPP family protein [Kerstersia gyiorum]|uniref:HPP family protein n=1 Tax=Kerstersia gyiorum TaxID=206506 RepID=UPI0021505D1D|nr:HPP family protein [Kerstersia gyiorum]MCR4157473.1 HPP family protein [Kerstersia gyiorum]